MPKHQGTHIDAPNHFQSNRPSVDELRPQDLFAPAVVVDVKAKVTADADYRLSVTDLEAWEKQHGQIPERALVLLHTGWGRQFMNPSRYRNQDGKGKMHFPGYSAPAVRFLIDRRNIRGIGIDTLSTDYGLAQDFPVHHLLADAGRYGLENLANLEQLPTRDFYAVVAPIKIETGSGGPTRVLAIVP